MPIGRLSSFPSRFVALYLALALLAALPSGEVQAQEVVPIVRLDIPEQELSTALTQFGREIGTEIVFSPDAVRSKRARALKGEYGRDQALKLLLEGTGLSYRMTTQGVVVVEMDKPAERASVTPPEATGSQDIALDEVVVTARKRDERLLEIPLSVSVFGGDDIRNAGLKGLEDISAMTPGFQFDNMGNQEPGRYNTQLKFRGLTTAQFSPSFATGALFIDGIYVLNGGTSLSLMDVEQIEVIKGPQAAYFGRNTFGGAVNVITRDPNLQQFGGKVELRTTSRSNNEVSAFLEGPIIREILSVSFGSRYYDKAGHYKATNGDRTGNEKTIAYNVAVKLQATDSLRFKLRYGYSEDEDGAPTQAFLSGKAFDTCTGRTVETATGSVSLANYICGRVPYTTGLPGRPGSGEISSNTRLPTGFPILGQPFDLDELLTDPGLKPGPLSKIPDVGGVGLQRETKRFSLFGTYEFGAGYSVDLSYGNNEQGANWIRDFDQTDRLNWFSRDPQYMKDESYEIRLTSPVGRRLRWAAGYNHYEQDFIGAGGGGDNVLSCFATAQAPPSNNYPADCIGGVPGVRNVWLANRLQNADHADVSGIFGSLDFDIADSLVASVEGRWQQDELTKGGGVITPGAPILRKSFDQFLPRVILRWEPINATNLWLSYSQGQIAGDFNTDFINADDRERAQYQQQDSRISEVLDAEMLDAWEIGWKQRLHDGMGMFSLAAYYYTWENIKGRSSYVINETCRPANIGVLTECNPANGIIAGDPKQLPGANGELAPFFIQRPTLLPGDATIKGAEFEGWLNFGESLRGHISAAYIDAKYDDYSFNGINQPGLTQMAGKRTPRQPAWSGSVALTWSVSILGKPSYLRGDYVYNGKKFVDEANLAYIGDYSLTNLRLGMDLSNRWTLEIFATNVFDEKAWRSGARWSDFSLPPVASLLRTDFRLG